MNVLLYMRFVAVFVENMIIQPTKGSNCRSDKSGCRKGPRISC